MERGRGPKMSFKIINAPPPLSGISLGSEKESNLYYIKFLELSVPVDNLLLLVQKLISNNNRIIL